MSFSAVDLAEHRDPSCRRNGISGSITAIAGCHGCLLPGWAGYWCRVSIFGTQLMVAAAFGLTINPAELTSQLIASLEQVKQCRAQADAAATQLLQKVASVCTDEDDEDAISSGSSDSSGSSGGGGSLSDVDGDSSSSSSRSIKTQLLSLHDDVMAMAADCELPQLYRVLEEIMR